MTFGRLLLVILGGMLGTAGRLTLGLVIPNAGGLSLATLAANVLGALLIGVLAVRLPRSSDMRVFLGTGILGGFTTYSAFSIGSVELWADAPAAAFAYAVVTIGLGIGAGLLGMRVGRPRGKAAR